MKLSRRCFLSLVVGGAAGTALTPLPWKITDDISIWSQNWPWTPVPPDGAGTYVDSTCTLCPGGCGISVRKIDDRAVKIEGLQGHPLNDGGICMLGLSGLQLLYGPTRVQAPLKRVGERGQGQWKTISWRQAIGEVAEKLGDLRQRGKPEALACIAPKDQGTVAQLMDRLMAAYGSPNFFRMPSVEDAYEAALYLTQGATGHTAFDVGNADFILSFGSALLDGYGSPVRMFRANSKLKEVHGTVVQVEPRLSNTAAKADQWLPLQPGTEADLALAMANVIISQNAANVNFLDAQTEGFEAFSKMVQERYSVETVASRTGIEAAVIAEVALKFARAKKPLALCGRGKGQVPGSLKEALAIHALNALVGSINAEGGVMAMPAYDYIDWAEVVTDDVAAKGRQTPRVDGAGSAEYPNVRYLLNHLAYAADGIEALLVAEANPCYALPGSKDVKAAFDNIPFVVSFSSFFDETAMNADLILPNHVYLERYEDVPVTFGAGSPTVGLCRPVVEPLYATQHVGDTILQVAKALQGSVAASFPWPDYEACLEQSLGSQWDTLIEEGVWQNAAMGGGFETDSGKMVLMNDSIGAVYMADGVALQGDAATYPLLLVPFDSIRLSSRYIGDPPFMVKTVSDRIVRGNDGFVEINPETAAKFSLADGQSATLTTPVGEARVKVSYYDGVMPGVVAMPRGLGHTAYDDFLAGKGVQRQSTHRSRWTIPPPALMRLGYSCKNW
jgi:anaerobic selenocysteine-containing dehydrogenase